MQSLNPKRPQTVPNDSMNHAMPQIVKNENSTKKNEQIYQNQVWNQINTNNRRMESSDRNIFQGKCDDPLTNFRDILRNLSNKDAFKYMRQCRLIVGKLKKCWTDVNEEVKSLNKNKEYVESAIDHIRKDIIINQEIIDGRIHKANREPNTDSVDDALVVEKQNLLALKKSLEIILKPIQDHTFKLDDTRERVFKLCRERSAVTDLICQCITQSIRSYDKSVAAHNKNKSTLNNSSLSRSHNSFAPTKMNSERSKTDFAGDHNESSNLFQVGPLSSFTQESIDIIKIAASQIDYSKDIRSKSTALIKDCLEYSKKNTKVVDDVFQKKIAETLALSQNLGVSSGQNSLAQNRGERWHELTQVALGYSLGPEKSSNLETYETMTRPIMKNFQKHPGNQVAEIAQTIQGTKLLSKSLVSTEKQIKTLKIIGQRLDNNMKDKEVQFKLDNALLRRRRELNNHQWTPVKYIK